MNVEPAADGLPEIPGGWTLNTYEVLDQTITLAQPSDPDAFLEDPDVLEAHRRDEYMPYWPYLWPASQAMSPLILRIPEWPRGESVLEIGSGIGLVGIVAASRGWQVTLSDYDQTSLLLAKHNAGLNGHDLEAIQLDWRKPLERRFDNIIACDVLYEERSHEPILGLLDSMLGNGEAWIGDPGRTHLPAFFKSACELGWKIRILTSDGESANWPQVGQFQILVLRRS